MDSEQRYYLQRSRAKRSDESDLEYANNSITLVVKTSSDLQVLSPDDVAFRLNTRNSAASNQSMANDIPDEDFLSADMKEEVDIQLIYTSDIIYITTQVRYEYNFRHTKNFLFFRKQPKRKEQVPVRPFV